MTPRDAGALKRRAHLGGVAHALLSQDGRHLHSCALQCLRGEADRGGARCRGTGGAGRRGRGWAPRHGGGAAGRGEAGVRRHPGAHRREPRRRSGAGVAARRQSGGAGVAARRRRGEPRKLGSFGAALRNEPRHRVFFGVARRRAGAACAGWSGGRRRAGRSEPRRQLVVPRFGGRRCSCSGVRCGCRQGGHLEGERMASRHDVGEARPSVRAAAKQCGHPFERASPEGVSETVNQGVAQRASSERIRQHRAAFKLLRRRVRLRSLGLRPPQRVRPRRVAVAGQHNKRAHRLVLGCQAAARKGEHGGRIRGEPSGAQVTRVPLRRRRARTTVAGRPHRATSRRALEVCTRRALARCTRGALARCARAVGLVLCVPATPCRGLVSLSLSLSLSLCRLTSRAHTRAKRRPPPPLPDRRRAAAPPDSPDRAR